MQIYILGFDFLELNLKLLLNTCTLRNLRILSLKL